MSTLLRLLVLSLIILSSCQQAYSLLSKEEFVDIQSKATFETLSYETYLKIFKNNKLSSRENPTVNEQLEHVKQYHAIYQAKIQQQGLNQFQQTQTSQNLKSLLSPSLPISSPSELAKQIDSQIQHHNQEIETLSTKANTNSKLLPRIFDWRDEKPNCFDKHPIKDQGDCSSCYAFATTFALARRFCVKNRYKYKLDDIDLSPQDMLDCDDKNRGCNGGLIFLSWEFLEQEGVATEECRPYSSGATGEIGKCRKFCNNFMSSYYKYRTAEFTLFTVYSDEEIKNEIYNKGPITTVMDVYDDFETYKGGIYRHIKVAGEKATGHAIVLLGWGFDSRSKTEFWIAANNWGENWGEFGYFKIPFQHCEIGAYATAAEPLFT